MTSKDEKLRMSLKNRIEALKLPGNNGPALRLRSIQNKRLVALLAKRITSQAAAPCDKI